MFSKICLDEMDSFTLLGARSIFACIIILPFVIKKLKNMSKADIVAGIILGVLFFLTMIAELIGLKTTPSSIAGILENTAIVMVPLLLAIIYRKIPNIKALLCCTVALVGIIFISVN